MLEVRRQTLIQKEMTKKMKENLEAETNRYLRACNFFND